MHQDGVFPVLVGWEIWGRLGLAMPTICHVGNFRPAIWPPAFSDHSWAFTGGGSSYGVFVETGIFLLSHWQPQRNKWCVA